MQKLRVKKSICGEISAELAESLAGAFAHYARRKTLKELHSSLKMAVGWDCRLSSPGLAAAVVRGLRKGGIDTVRLGICPTPLLYFGVSHDESFDGGIMVTNGFELLLGAELLSDGEWDEVRGLMDGAETPSDVPLRGTVTDTDVFPLYRRYIYQNSLAVNPIIPKKKRRIVVDLGNGTASVVFPQVLHTQFECFGLNRAMDGRFPNRHPSAFGAEDLRPLAETIRRESAEFGVALDGDANRIAVLDETGRLLSDGELTSIYSKSVMEKPPRSTLLGEGKSGRFRFGGNYYGYDDAIFSTLRLCEIVSHLNGPISRLI